MSKKFLVVESTGAYEENLGYGTEEFINTSAGAGSAGLPIVLDSNGLIDSSMISLSNIEHGTLGGLGDDDHTQYSLADGSRNYSAVVSYTSHPTFANDTEIVDKKYVDDITAGERWEDGVLSRIAVPPASPTLNDRYIVIPTATGAWVGHEEDIAEWNGTSWDFYTPATGWKVSVADELDRLYLYDGSDWQAKLFESTTASLGIQKIGVDLQINPTLAGDGLAFTTGVMSVNVDDSSVEIATDTLQVKALGITNDMLAGSIADGKLASDYIQTSEVDDVTIEFGTTLNVKADGINDTHIDFGAGLNQVNASDLPILDAGAYTDATDVEAALQELYLENLERGVLYTSAGVTKGDLVYVSANDTVSTLSTITNADFVIGMAASTVGAASDVKVLADDTIATGVLSAASFGETFFWDGSSLVNSIPNGGGAYVWQAGIAKNATDLHVDIKRIKKNAA